MSVSGLFQILLFVVAAILVVVGVINLIHSAVIFGAILIVVGIVVAAIAKNGITV